MDAIIPLFLKDHYQIFETLDILPFKLHNYDFLDKFKI